MGGFGVASTFLLVLLLCCTSAASAAGGPLPVYIAIHIESIFNLDVTGATYTTKLEGTMAYQVAASLSDIPTNPVVNNLHLEKLPLWVIIEPLNSISTSFSTDITRWSASVPRMVPSTAVSNATLPWLVRQFRMFTTNSDSAELRSFPFDSHVCTTQLALKYPTASQATLVLVSTDSVPEYLDDAWQITWHNFTTGLQVVDSTSGETYSSIAHRLGITRRTAYYRGKIVTVMSVLVCMAWLLFFLQMTDASRILSTSTIFLVLVTFNLSTQDSLPRVSYLTRLDSYTLLTLINTFFVFIIFNFQYLMETLIATRQAKIDDYDDAEEVAAAKTSQEPFGNLDIWRVQARRQTAWTTLGPFRREGPARTHTATEEGGVPSSTAGAQRGTTHREDQSSAVLQKPRPQLSPWMAFWSSHRHRINFFFFSLAVIPFVIIAPILIYEDSH